jgi:hypothetical protein
LRITPTRLTSIFLACILVAVAACSGDASPTPSANLSVVAIGRDLSTETDRLPIALLVQQDGGAVRVDDASDHIRLSYRPLEGDDLVEVDVVEWQAWPVSGGAYVFDPDFTAAGTWEIRAEVDQARTTYTGSTFVTVEEQTSSVPVGQPAPLSHTKTGATEAELLEVTSDATPDPALYEMTVAEAVQSGRPTVIAFSTPAFCQSATCGPQLDVVSSLQAQYGEQVNFVHVEVWDNPREMLDTGDPNIGVIAPAVEEWGLITEPWTFLVDENGIVFDKFEAFTTNDELSSSIDRMLSGA